MSLSSEVIVPVQSSNSRDVHGYRRSSLKSGSQFVLCVRAVLGGKGFQPGNLHIGPKWQNVAIVNGPFEGMVDRDPGKPPLGGFTIDSEPDGRWTNVRVGWPTGTELPDPNRALQNVAQLATYLAAPAFVDQDVLRVQQTEKDFLIGFETNTDERVSSGHFCVAAIHASLAVLAAHPEGAIQSYSFQVLASK